MSNASDITTRIITALQLSDPAWDINPGSPEYKMIDAFANQLSTVNNNNTLNNYSFDPNSMSGNQLDQFVSYFGIQRQQGTRATGTVTASCGSPVTSPIYIPMGTQFYVPTPATNGTVVYFQTTSQAVIPVDGSSVEVPVEATTAGSAANVLQNQINGISSPLVGINTVTNVFSTSGGSDAETDAQLRARFLATAFRNESGTFDQYIGTVTDNTAVTNANVIGSNAFYSETLPVIQYITLSSGATGTFTITFNSQATAAITIGGSDAATAANIQSAINAVITAHGTAMGLASGQIVVGVDPVGANTFGLNFNTPLINTNIWSISTITGSGTAAISGPAAISDIPDSKYAFPAGAETITYGLYNSGGTYGIGVPSVDYTYNPASGGDPPVIIDILTSGPNYTTSLALGNIIGLQSEYIPESSRNYIDEDGNVINNVDIFVQGSNPVFATAETALLHPSSEFSTLEAAGARFIVLEGTPPNDSDFFVPLLPQPSLSVSNVSASGFPNLQQGFCYDPTYTIAVFSTIPSSGTYTLTVTTNFVDSSTYPTPIAHTTAAIPWNATSAQIQSALMALNIGLFIVTGGPIGASQINIVMSWYEPNTGDATASYPTITATYPGGWSSLGTENPELLTTEWYLVFENDESSSSYPRGARQGSPLALAGIGITAATYSTIETGAVTPLVVQFNFDKLINDLNSSVQLVTLINQNALVHSVVDINLLVNLVVSYGAGNTQSQINASITTALTNYFNTITFNGEVVIADVLQAVLSASGVQNVRLATSTDNSTFYGIQKIQADGVTVSSTSSTNLNDFFLASNELPTLYGVNTYLRALGSFTV